MPWKAIKYSLPFVIVLSIYRALFAQGLSVFLPIIMSFVIVPAVEIFLNPATGNLTAAEEAMAKKERLYDWLLYLIVPAQVGAVMVFASQITSPQWQGYELAGKTLALGLSCGVFGINVAHELGHRNTWYEKAMAKILLITTLYSQFIIEHNKGHHRNVSTPHDPSSAPYGTSLYAFWWRSITGVYRDAWRIANAECRKKGKPVFSLHNEMLQLQLLTVLWLLALVLLFGVKALLLYLPAAVMGILLLETVNYIEHYGLARKLTDSGVYERAKPIHSWNSSHPLGRIVLFELSRHSDHHYLASRPYQILRHHNEAPQLPTGYPGSMILATIPPLWFRIMDRQLKTYHML